MFIANGTKLRCNLADYLRDFGFGGSRLVQTQVGVYLWHATYESQLMVGSRVLEVQHTNGTQYFLQGSPVLFTGISGLGLSLQDRPQHVDENLSEAGLLPHGEIKRYRPLTFFGLLEHVAHSAYRSMEFEKALPLAEALSLVVSKFKKVPQLFDENRLREGMDVFAEELGFTASHHIVVGDDSFDRYLLRAVEALAPQQITALQAEVQR